MCVSVCVNENKNKERNICEDHWTGLPVLTNQPQMRGEWQRILPRGREERLRGRHATQTRPPDRASKSSSEDLEASRDRNRSRRD